ncbi:MAG: tetratricopeptide repeat protein [Acidobacteriota bacterium]
MKRALTVSLVSVAASLVMFVGCRSGGGDLSKAENQRQFGVRMARMNLWREAMFRFRRATQIDPANAMAHNNLAVSLEANGDFDSAGKEYREALRLDRSNQYIQKNYSRFVEFTQRAKKRDVNAPKVSANPAASKSTTPAGPAIPAPPSISAESPGPPQPPPDPRDPTSAPTTTSPPDGGGR